ncbi:MAG: ABC transporter permease [Anaerolineae bacterium]|nr:ABC transporter permease [Anaerolineae bacterium]
MNWKIIKSHLRVVFLTFEMTFRQNMVDSFILFTIVVQPLLIAILAMWMLRERGGDYAIFVIVGSGMSGLWSSLLFVSGNSITSERWNGNLEGLVASPTPIQFAVFGKAMANVTQSLLSMIASYSVVAVLFDVQLRMEQPLVFFSSLVLTMLTFMTFGLIISSVFVINPDVQRWQNGLEFPIFILAGFLFPISLLPGWTNPLSYILAPYWATRVLHAATVGLATSSEIILTWSMMILFGILYIALSGRMFKKMLYRARVEATLNMQ